MNEKNITIETVQIFILNNDTELAEMWSYLKGNVIEFFYSRTALRHIALIINHEYYLKYGTGTPITDFVSMDTDCLGKVCILPKNIFNIHVFTEEEAIIWLLETDKRRSGVVEENSKFDKYPVRSVNEKVQ